MYLKGMESEYCPLRIHVCHVHSLIKGEDWEKELKQSQRYPRVISIYFFFFLILVHIQLDS